MSHVLQLNISVHLTESLLCLPSHCAGDSLQSPFTLSLEAIPLPKAARINPHPHCHGKYWHPTCTRWYPPPRWSFHSLSLKYRQISSASPCCRLQSSIWSSLGATEDGPLYSQDCSAAFALRFARSHAATGRDARHRETLLAPVTFCAECKAIQPLR